MIDASEAVAAVVHHPRVKELGRNDAEQARVNDFARDLAKWLLGVPRSELGALARVLTVIASRELRDPRRLCRDHPLMAVEAAARITEQLWPLVRGPLEEEEEEEEEPPPPAESDGSADTDGAGGGGASADSDGTDDTEGDSGEEGTGEQGAAPIEVGSGGSVGAEGEQGDTEDAEGEDAPGEPKSSSSGSEEGDDGTEGDDAPAPDPLSVLKALAEMGTGPHERELSALAEQASERIAANLAEDVSQAAGDVVADAIGAGLDGAMEVHRAASLLEQFVPGVGWSRAPGELHRSLTNYLERLSTLLGRMAELEELARALGRMEASDRRAGPKDGGSEEVVGVRLSGDVSRALPCELALLGDPETEDLFYQRWLEKRLISLELSGAGIDGVSKGDERGPVIACIDTSGSMEGPPEWAAKALVLALCRRVLPQGRTVHLILFGGPDERTELRLRRGRGGLEQIIDFLSLAFCAGTDFDGPLLRAMDLLEEAELRRADVLVVTDGRCMATREVIERVKSVKEKMGVRIWSVVLGSPYVNSVKPFSDEVFDIDPTDAARSIGVVHRLGLRRHFQSGPKAP